MISEISAILRRAKDIQQTEGLKTLLKRGFAFVKVWFFEYGDYYLYEHTLRERNEADFLPIIQDFTFQIISNNKEADELAAIGSDFRRRFVSARRSLDKGAIAFCFFVNGQIVNIGFVATNEEAKNTFDPLPYKVDFASGEACSGGTITVPEYRGKGLMAYGYSKRLKYMRENGIRVSRNSVAKGNMASQKVHARFGPRMYAEAKYLKLLRWRFWKEKPLTQAAPHD